MSVNPSELRLGATLFRTQGNICFHNDGNYKVPDPDQSLKDMENSLENFLANFKPKTLNSSEEG